MSQPKIQVGTRVRVISNAGRILRGYHQVRVPFEGTVLIQDPCDDLMEWAVPLPDGQVKWFAASDLEVLS